MRRPCPCATGNLRSPERPAHARHPRSSQIRNGPRQRCTASLGERSGLDERPVWHGELSPDTRSHAPGGALMGRRARRPAGDGTWHRRARAAAGRRLFAGGGRGFDAADPQCYTAWPSTTGKARRGLSDQDMSGTATSRRLALVQCLRRAPGDPWVAPQAFRQPVWPCTVIGVKVEVARVNDGPVTLTSSRSLPVHPGTRCVASVPGASPRFL